MRGSVNLPNVGLMENQLLQTWIQQWQQLHAWHKTRKEKEAAEADQQQIQQLKHQLQHKKLKPKLFTSAY